MKDSWFTETEIFLLHEIVARLDRLARRRALDARDVSYPEFLVAMAVRELPEPTHGEVGELLDMSKSLVSQRVSTLLAKGIVEQRREQPDRRQARLALTASRRETLEAQVAADDPLLGIVFDPSDDDTAKLLGVDAMTLH